MLVLPGSPSAPSQTLLLHNTTASQLPACLPALLQVRVFLLSLRAGAAGLTLTAASRVFLLEPGLDPAIEQQAVARVHRIGQEREVVITRLLVQGSVEAQVGV
jgi:SNF2 family DNA or RNA helicase